MGKSGCLWLLFSVQFLFKSKAEKAIERMQFWDPLTIE